MGTGSVSLANDCYHPLHSDTKEPTHGLRKWPPAPASARGREFFYELLRSVSLEDEPRILAGLAQLVDAELVYQRGALPEADFTFKHSMIQDTAYQSPLRGARQQFHERIAKVLEERFPERVET